MAVETQPEVPTVMILVATYNGARFLADQLATLHHQRGVKTRVVVRDDGSHDTTRAVIEADGRATLIEPEGAPTGLAGRNFLRMLCLADFGEADYIAFADQDDLWLGTKLARAVECMQRSGAAGYSCNLVAFDDDGGQLPWLVSKHGRQKRCDYLFQGASAGCTYVLTRACADALREWVEQCELPTDLTVSHDWMIYAFARSRKLTWFIDDRALILYRQHRTNVYGSRRGLKDILERVKLLRDRWYRRHILWLAGKLELDGEAREVIARVARLSPFDRLWLALQAAKLRRRPREIWMLRLALLTGLF